MYREEISSELRNIIAEYLKGKNVELIDLILRYEGKDLFLRLLVDYPEGGITIHECSSINYGIGAILDEKDIVPGRYVLEVSSPGLDRPLKTKRDFERSVQKPVRLFFTEDVSGKMEMEGVIEKVEDDALYIETEEKITRIELEKIRVGKQIIEMP